MKYISDAFDRGRVADFHKNSYETVFSVFMVAVVFFYRGNPTSAVGLNSILPDHSVLISF